jgi:hypothetical protein
MVFQHNCNSGTCDHRPSADDSISCSLLSRIDLDNVQCLNEETDGSCKKVFRSYEDRLNRDFYVKSDCGQDLLFNIPFSGTVKLKSLVLIGPNDGSHPFNAKLFKNKPHMTFDQVNGVECDQEISLAQDTEGEISYPLKTVKFSSISHLSIYIPRNYDNDDDTSTMIYYIGLNGDFMGAHKQSAIITSYEAQANPADHKIEFTKHVFQENF